MEKKGNGQKTSYNVAEKQRKAIVLCAKILQELERIAPEAIHVKELAYKCNTSAQIVNRTIAINKDIFRFVEVIEGENYIKYRLNVDEKVKQQQEKIKKPILYRIKITLHLVKKP